MDFDIIESSDKIYHLSNRMVINGVNLDKYTVTRDDTGIESWTFQTDSIKVKLYITNSTD